MAVRSTVTITNIPGSPMLMNPMSGATLDMLRNRHRKQIKTDWSEGAEAASKLMSNSVDGMVVIPAANLLACLVGAGRGVSYKGKANLSTLKDSKVPSLIRIEEENIPLLVNEEPVPAPREGEEESRFWKTDKRRGCNPADGVAVCLVRPKFTSWSATFTLLIDSEISEETAKKLVDVAGRFSGLGDFRPSKKGPFGQFYVRRWIGEEIESLVPRAELIQFAKVSRPTPEPEAKKAGRKGKGKDAGDEQLEAAS